MALLIALTGPPGPSRTRVLDTLEHVADMHARTFSGPVRQVLTELNPFLDGALTAAADSSQTDETRRLIQGLGDAFLSLPGMHLPDDLALRGLLSVLDPHLDGETEVAAAVAGGWDRALTHPAHGSVLAALLERVAVHFPLLVGDPDLWTMALGDQMAAQSAIAGPMDIVLSDLTTDAQAHWVLAAGGQVWDVQGGAPASATGIDPQLVTRTIPVYTPDLTLIDALNWVPLPRERSLRS